MMIATKPHAKGSVTTLMQYADTGESGETYDVDVETVPWSKLGHLKALASSLKGAGRSDYSESGEAYEAEAEAGDENKREEKLRCV